MSDEELQPQANPDEMLSDEDREKQIDVEEESSEFELTPEIEAIIMGKVQDIDDYGTAFSRIIGVNKYSEYAETHNIKRLAKILENGLLGQSRSKKFNPSKETWAEGARKREPLFVYFNIVGRMLDVLLYHREGRTERRELDLTDFTRYGNAITLIFDLESFKEDAPVLCSSGAMYTPDGQRIRSEGLIKNRTYSVDQAFPDGYRIKDFENEVNQPESVKKLGITQKKNTGLYFSSRGDLMANNSDYGFIARTRVAPVLFKGLVIKLPNVNDKIEFDESSVIEKITKTMEDVSLEKYNYNSLLPVYNANGNLLWPRRMSYEEVKFFVAERDKHKNQDINKQETEQDAGTA